MYSRSMIARFVITLAMVTAGAQGQTNMSVVNRNERLPTLSDSLKRHHVATTEAALVEALQSANAEVRSLAALKLAEDRAKGAVPAMNAALGAERELQTRTNIAFALAQLGSAAGVGALQDICDKGHGSQRLVAARYMLDLNREDCFKAVLDELGPEADAGSRTEAMALVSRFRRVSQADSEKMFAVLVESLKAPSPAVRLTASSTLSELGNVSAVAYLQDAVGREKDESVRSGMQADLQKLQGKNQER